MSAVDSHRIWCHRCTWPQDVPNDGRKPRPCCQCRCVAFVHQAPFTAVDSLFLALTGADRKFLKAMRITIVAFEPLDLPFLRDGYSASHRKDRP